MTDDVDFEPEDELGTTGSLKAKLQKLRDELEEVKKERQEYLDGWQRCKADGVNARRDALQAIEKSTLVAQERIVEEIIPVVDSFDMAMMGDAWSKVDETWRRGVESIKGQLLSALEGVGARPFGEMGDTFDHEKHYALQEINGGDAQTIARIILRGWELHEKVIRPAHVTVYSGQT